MTAHEHPLVAVLRACGIHVPAAGPVEREVLCWMHDDHDPSLHVNVTSGVFHCKACNHRGSVWTFLTRDRGLSGADARALLKSVGANPDMIESEIGRGDRIAAEKSARARGLPKRTDKFYFEEHIRARHEYRDRTGRLICVVVRHKSAKVGGKKLAKTLPYVPRSEGGWWQCKPGRQALPDEDRHEGLMPLYGLAGLEGHEGTVMLVEGESSADAVNGCGGPARAVCCYGGTTSPVKSHDWSPLEGRRLLIVADADDPGRRHVQKVAKHLHRLGFKFHVAEPPGDDGFDVAEARSLEGGGWRGIHSWVQPHIKPYEPPAKEDPDVPPPGEAKVPLDVLGDNEHYQVLGVVGSLLVVQIKATHQIHYLPQNDLVRQGNQQMIARLSFWQDLAGAPGIERSPGFRATVADGLLAAGWRKGVISPDNMFGRGAIKSGGAIAFHVGDGLLVAKDGKRRLTERAALSRAPAEHDALLMPRPKIRMTDDPRAREHGRELVEVLSRYRWAHPDHGKIFLGWLVSSLVGGALPHRPAVWLLGPSGAGKSFLLETVMDPLHQGFRKSINDTTEAGTSSYLGDDSLPTTIDEFEPSKNEDRAAVHARVLSLVRRATGGTSVRVRGTAAGGHVVTRARASFLASSISQPRMSEADESRIVTISLAEEGVEDWPALARDIERVTEPSRMAALRTEIIRETPDIVARCERAIMRIQRSESRRTSTRQAQVMGALSACYAWLADQPGQPAIIRKPARAAMAEQSAALRLEAVVAMMSLSFEHRGIDRTLAEILREGWVDAEGKLIVTHRRVHPNRGGSEEARDAAARLGWRFYGERLAMALGFDPVAKQLARTDYAGSDIDNLVLRLPGVELYARQGSRSRLSFAGVSRRVALFDLAIARELGIVPPPGGEEEEDGSGSDGNVLRLGGGRADGPQAHSGDGV